MICEVPFMNLEKYFLSSHKKPVVRDAKAEPLNKTEDDTVDSESSLNDKFKRVEG